MSSNINILKWLFALVLIFGGFTVYKIFGVLAADLEGKEYVWLVKIISEFGLFTSVVISVGFFHHWIIATEERKETEKMFHNVLTKYIDGTVINAKTRGFLGITNNELIILRDKARIVEIFNSFYLSEPVGRMPYLHWQSELKCDTSYSFESEKWNMPDLFLDYFQRRWLAERKKLDRADKENLAYNDFLYAPASARKKCTSLICELDKSNVSSKYRSI